MLFAFLGMDWTYLAFIACSILLLVACAVVGLGLIIKTAIPDRGTPMSWLRRLVKPLVGLVLVFPILFCVLGPSVVLPASNAGLREKITVGMTMNEVRSVL